MNLDSLGFKFKIGEIVQHRIAVPSLFAKSHCKTPVLIVGRYAEECSGGVQFFYEVRVGTVEAQGGPGFDPRNTHRVHEIELENIPEGSERRYLNKNE